jgi:hypothetical protein
MEFIHTLLFYIFHAGNFPRYILRAYFSRSVQFLRPYSRADSPPADSLSIFLYIISPGFLSLFYFTSHKSHSTNSILLFCWFLFGILRNNYWEKKLSYSFNYIYLYFIDSLVNLLVNLFTVPLVNLFTVPFRCPISLSYFAVPFHCLISLSYFTLLFRCPISLSYFTVLFHCPISLSHFTVLFHCPMDCLIYLPYIKFRYECSFDFRLMFYTDEDLNPHPTGAF